MQNSLIEIIQPDDWHIHLREGELLNLTVAAVSRIFGRCLAMPNLAEPIVSLEQLQLYSEAIKKIGSIDAKIALYMVQDITPKFVESVAHSKLAIGFKLYPAGATTNSLKGVNNIDKMFPVFAAMQQVDLPLLIHGEVVDSDIDIFDREKLFIDRYLQKIVATFPKLRVVFEHITTTEAVAFVNACSANVAATITPQHLLLNRNDLLVGGIKPHNYCLPVLKRHTHQQQLIKAATSGNPKFFLGTDSAPHEIANKHTDCGCAGCFSGLNSLELYTAVFHSQNAMDKLEGFASIYGANFYKLPLNSKRVTIFEHSHQIPKTVSAGSRQIRPFLAGETLNFSCEIVN